MGDLRTLGDLHEFDSLWVIDVLGNRPVHDALHRLVDDEQRDQKPLAWNDRLPKAIIDAHQMYGFIAKQLSEGLEYPLEYIQSVLDTSKNE